MWSKLAGLSAVALALTSSACATTSNGPDQAAASTLIRNVTVIPMDRPEGLPARDVLVRGDRVVAVARANSLRTRGGAVIDGAGKFLIPGLWDMHVHALGENVGAVMADYARHGVVGVRDMGSTVEDLQAARTLLASRNDLPALVAAGPLLDGPRQRWTQRVALPLGTLDEARRAAGELADARVDFLKIYNNLTADQHAAVADVARRRGLTIAGHVPFRMTVEQVSSAGQTSIEHAGLQLVTDCIPGGGRAISAELGAWIARGYPGRYAERARWWAKRKADGCRALYRRMARRRTSVVPTLTNEVRGGRWTTERAVALLGDAQRRACEADLRSINADPAARDAADRLIFDLVADLHAAGVPLLAGTDTPNGCLSPGRSLHDELRLLVAAGLTPWDALRTATRGPAEFLGRVDEGVVRPGAVASLVLLDRDPLQDVSATTTVRGVMLRGRWLPLCVDGRCALPAVGDRTGRANLSPGHS